MRIAGQSQIAAAPDRVWPLIFDPQTLLQLLPGCEDVTQVADGEYRARMTLPVAAVAGTYDAYVRILEHEAPRFCTLEGEASGPGGSVRGSARFTLTQEGEGSTIAYEADAQIAGPLAGMNPRFAEGVAQTLIRQGLARLPELARDREAGAARASAVAETAPAGPAVNSGGPRAAGDSTIRLLLAAFGAGLRAWLADLKDRLVRSARD